MKQFTKENFSTAFQVIIIALLFIYAAFPGKSTIIENAETDQLPGNKIRATQQEVKHSSIHPLFTNDAPQKIGGNKTLTWVMPGMKSIVNTHPETTDMGSVNTQKINGQ